MNPERFKFIEEQFTEELKGKKVLEVGSRYIKGSMREYMESLKPDEYVGVDIEPGKGVDQIVDVHDLGDHFGDEVFDIILCSDTLEHIEDYWSASQNMHRVLKTGGTLVVSVPDMTTKYHGFPHDYWRYTLDDLKYIYRDMKYIEGFEKPGACIVAEKRSGNFQTDPDYRVHSILRGKPVARHTLADKKLLSRYRKSMLGFRKFLVRYTPQPLKNLMHKVSGSS